MFFNIIHFNELNTLISVFGHLNRLTFKQADQKIHVYQKNGLAIGIDHSVYEHEQLL